MRSRMESEMDAELRFHIQAVAESTRVASIEEVCWLAIAAATAWLPQREPAETALP